MEEIKLGEYIRTNSGTIAKLKRIEFDKVDKDLKWYFYDKKEPDINIIKEWCINKPYIVKHSLNIIDLIEEGDYVNGTEVVTVYGYDEDWNDKDELGIIEVVGEEAYGIYLTDMKKIKDIVTKEQFNQRKYIVGDESNVCN